MTMVTGALPKAGAKPNRQQRRQAARLAKKGRRGNGAAAPADAALQEAVKLHKGGHSHEALQLYRKILADRPDQVDALNLSGVANLELNHVGEAVKLLQAAVRLQPSYAEAHNNLGNALQAAGRLDEAAAAYRRAIGIKPGYAEAHYNLGILLQKSNDTAGAVAAYRRAVAIQPNFAEAYNSLGAVLQPQGKVDEAIGCYRSAVAIDPDYAEPYNSLGAALAMKGRHDEAIVEFEKALAIKPGLVSPYNGIAAAKKVRPDDDLILRIEKILREENFFSDEKSTLYFALGKCFDDIGEFDKAFHHFRIANDISRKSSAFDFAAFTEKIDRLIKVFSPAFFAERRAFGSESERPVFIVGMPRSGTTLIEQIVASHPNVFGAGELPLFHRTAVGLPAIQNTTASYPECAALMNDSTVARFADEYLTHLDALSPHTDRVTDKMPENFQHLGLISLLFPHARVIHCQRDPLDTCLSCYFLDFTGWLPFTYDLTKLGQYYHQYLRLMAHWRTALPTPVLEVRYEDLVADKEAVSRRMIAFCGLDWDDACLAFHETDRPILTGSHWQARQSIYKSSVGRWRRYEQHLGPLKQALAGAG